MSAFDPDAAVRHPLPEGWSLMWYGVSSSYVRRKLKEAAEDHGLRKADKGGSVYLGVSDKELDRKVQEIADTLAPGEVHLVPGSYAQTEAGFFTRGLADRAFEDMGRAEEALRELERAMAGEVEIINPKTKLPRNLVSVGDSRFDTADYTLAGVDTAAQRLSSHPGTAQVGERLATRVAQMRAWVDKLAWSHKARRAELQERYDNDPRIVADRAAKAAAAKAKEEGAV